jgi:hypothetical protein
MKKENLSTSMVKLIMVVSLIVGVGSIIGMLGYFWTMPKSEVIRDGGVKKVEVKEDETIIYEIADWKTYESSEMNFSIKVLSDFKVFLDINPLDTPSYDKLVSNFYIKNTDNAHNAMQVSVESWTNYFNANTMREESPSSEWIDFDISIKDRGNLNLNKETIILDKNQAVKVSSEAKVSVAGDMEKRITVYSIKGNRIYIISAYIDAKQQDYYLPIFDQILSTFKFTESIESYKAIIDKLVPEKYSKNNASYFIDDLNNDGAKELIIGTVPVESDSGYFDEAYIAIVTDFNKDGRYKKIADYHINTENIEPMSIAPSVNYVVDIENDGKKELVLSLGNAGGAYTTASGIFKIDWNAGKISWLKMEKENENVQNASFLTGASLMHILGFELKDLDNDGILEVVEEENDYNGTSGDEDNMNDKNNWESKKSVYKWSGSLFYYDSKLSDIANLMAYSSPFTEIKDKIVNFEDSIKEQASDDLKQFIFQSMKKDFSSQNWCGTAEFKIEDYAYGASSLDLNNDGIKEFIIEPSEICGYFVGGASGNRKFYAVQKLGNDWKQIGDFGGNTYNVKSKKTNGYYNIITYAHLSSASGMLTYYEWDRLIAAYKEILSEEIMLNDNN